MANQSAVKAPKSGMKTPSRTAASDAMHSDSSAQTPLPIARAEGRRRARQKQEGLLRAAYQRIRELEQAHAQSPAVTDGQATQLNTRLERIEHQLLRLTETHAASKAAQVTTNATDTALEIFNIYQDTGLDSKLCSKLQKVQNGHKLVEHFDEILGQQLIDQVACALELPKGLPPAAAGKAQVQPYCDSRARH